tara:strand:+ start:3095 stop:3490 length:396 start_codon:yes stop_codon:yes gene_type:complete
MGFLFGFFGKKNGPVETYHSNGQLESRGVMRDGVLHGPYEWYYANAQLREKGTYKDGEKHGLLKTYHSSGQLQAKCSFKDGLPHGYSEIFDEKGQPMVRGNWNMHKECGEWFEYGETVIYDACPPDLEDGN